MLNSFLFPGLQTISDNGDLIPLTKGLRPLGMITVITRDHYSMTRKVLSRGDAVGVRAAKAQAEFESRYAEPVALVDLGERNKQSTLANIWTWDRHAIGALTGKPSLRVLPEPLARRPLESGARVVQALSGFDGEIWQNNFCVASRWWPEPPTEMEWDIFQRGAQSRYWPTEPNGTPILYALPQVEAASWISDRVFVAPTWSERLRSITPGQLIIAGAVLLAAPLAYNVSKIAQLNAEIGSLEQEVADRTRDAQPWLQNRRRALAQLNQITEMSELGAPEALIYALMDMEAALVSADTRAAASNYDAPTLEVRLEGGADSGLNVVSLVQSLEASTNWSDVRFDSNGGAIVGTVTTNEADSGATE